MSFLLLQRRSRKAGISTTLFLIAIVVTVIISATVTYILISPGVNSITKTVADADPLNSISDMFPVSPSNDTTTVNATTTSCYSGNWSAIYQEYQSPLALQNTTGVGEQYLNNSQFMSFLSQYLNLNDPWVNATVTGLLSNNETAFVQQQLQSQGLIC
jgi:hypothetical protein